MQNGAGCRKTQRAGVKALLNNRGHASDLGVSRRLVGGTALSHHVGANCAVGHLSSNVDRALQFFQCIQVLWERLPVPGHSLRQRATWNILNPLHQTDQPLSPLWCCGCKTNAAIPHHNRCNPVPGRRGHLRIPSGLPVIMGMDINEPRNDHAASGINLLKGRFRQRSHGHDSVTDNADIHAPARRPGTINHKPPRNFQVINHGSLSSSLAPGVIHTSSALRRCFSAQFPQQCIELLKQLLERIQIEQSMFDRFFQRQKLTQLISYRPCILEIYRQAQALDLRVS